MTAWILTSSILILVIVGLRQLLKGRIAPGFQYALWLLVLLRLLIPGSLTASPMSVENLLPREPAAQTAVSEPTPDRTYADVQKETAAPEAGVTSVPAAGSPVPESKAAPFDWSRLLKSIWIAGMLLAALALLASNWNFYLRLRRSRNRLDLDLPLPVYAAEGLPSPCLFGFLKPAVYVPAAYAEDRQAMAHILAHEWSHYKQGDHLWSLLRGVTLCVHWYNPLVWLAAVLSKQDAELACDAAAIRRLGEEQRLPYGRTLLKLVTGKPRPADLLTCATTMTSGKRSLKQRITYIAKKPKMLAVTAVLVALAAAVAVGCTFTGAETPEVLEAGSETLSDDENSANGLAWEYINSQIASLEDRGYTVLDAELTGMTPLTQAEASEYGASVIEYRLKLQDPETVSLSPGMEMTEDGWLTEKGSMGQPVLLTRVTGNTERLVDVQWTRYLEMVYGEDMELAAESEILYHSFRNGLSYDPEAKVLRLAEDSFDRSWSFQLSGMTKGTYVSDYFSYTDTAAENGHSRSVDLSQFETCHLEIRRDLENSESIFLGILDLLELAPASQPVEDLPAAWMEALGSAPSIQYVSDSAVRSSELLADLSTDAQLATLEAIFSGYTWTPYVGPSTVNQSDLQMVCASADGAQTLLFQEYQGQVRVYAKMNGETQVYDGSGSGPITTALLNLCNQVLLEAQGDLLTIALAFPTEDWDEPARLGYLTDLDLEAKQVTFDEVYWVEDPEAGSGFRLDPGPEGQTLPLAENCQYWILYRHSYPCLRLSAEGMQNQLSEGGLFRLYLQDGQVIAVCQRYIP